MTIAVIGTSFMDIKGFPENPSAPNGRSLGRVEYVHGGVARNIAEDIANMGLASVFVSSVDDTPMGRDVKERLFRHKVNTDYVITVPNGMGTWLALFDGTGDVASSVCTRPDTYALSGILENEGETIISSCDSIIFELDLHRDVVIKILELAEKYKKKTYAVVSNMRIAMQQREFFEKIDCLICNVEEMEILFSDNYIEKSPEQIKDFLAERIQSAHIASMIVTLGEKGAVYAQNTGNTGYIAAKEVVVKDTTGAGDAFCAGTVAALTYGKSMAEAAQIGTELAVSVVRSYDNVCSRNLSGKMFTLS